MRGFFNQHLDFYEGFYLHFPQRLSYRSATKCAEVALKRHRYRQVCIRLSLYPSGSHGKPARDPGVLPASPPTPSTEDDHLQSNYQTCLTGAKLRAELFCGWAVQRERISPDGQFPPTCPPSSNPAQSCCVGWCRGTGSVPGSLGLGIRNDTYRGPSWFPAQLGGVACPKDCGELSDSPRAPNSGAGSRAEQNSLQITSFDTATSVQRDCRAGAPRSDSSRLAASFSSLRFLFARCSFREH